MDHNDIRHKLSEYIDGTITPQERTAIEAHLPTCPDCAEALRELRKTIEHVRAIEELEPPAYMAQRIMAQVREAEQQRKIRRSLFDHFVLWRPVRVLAVLALTVTAYYIYLNLGPVGKHADAPLEMASRNEAPAPARSPGAVSERVPSARQLSPDSSAGSAAPAPKKSVGQSPEYRSLDMKYSYEQPAPPEPAAPQAAGAVRPTVAQEAAPPLAADTSKQLPAAPQAATPSDQRRKEERPRKEAKAPAAAAGMPAADIRLSLTVDAVPEAAARTAQAITSSGGTVLRIDAVPPVTVMRATLPTRALPTLRKALQQIGTLRDTTPSRTYDRSFTSLEITVSRTSSTP